MQNIGRIYKKLIVVSFALAMMSYSIGYANAADKNLRHETKFTVYFAGIPVGKAVFDLKLSGDAYQLSVSGRTIGLTKLLANGKGSVKSVGLIKGRGVYSQLQRLSYKDSKKNASALLVFKNKNLVSQKIIPKPKDHPEKIPVYDSDKIGVIDPASSIIIPVFPSNIGDGRKVCNRTLSIYDGEGRYDVRLNYKRDEEFSTKGFKGKAIVCQLRWIPIAGYRPKKNVTYMAANKKMEIAFAQVGNSAVYMPIKITVPTKYGTVIAEAKAFKLISN